MCAEAKTPGTALVLAGGGALGAYEAGVLSYVLTDLQKDLDGKACFNIFSGTSVGALNAAFLAAMADDPVGSAQGLVDYWKSVTLDTILRFGVRDLNNLLRLLSGRGPSKTTWKRRHQRPPAAPHPPVAGVFDTSMLVEHMRTVIPWPRIQDNFRTGILGGIALCATEICTGRSAIFYQAGSQTRYACGRDPMKKAIPVEIQLKHAMASAAIPFVFPAIQIDGVCYTDGGLRQNTPLNPALRFGAGRVMVVSVIPEPDPAFESARIGCRRSQFPGALFLVGKIMQALLSQSLDYELHRVEMYNRFIKGGSDQYGDDFIDTLNSTMGVDRNASFRNVHTCHIRPSQDLGELARQALRDAPDEISLTGPTGKLAASFLRSSAFAETDLLSVLMFTPTFIRMLLELGRRDAQANKESLIDFFSA